MKQEVTQEQIDLMKKNKDVDALIDALDCKNRESSCLAANALGEIGDLRAFEPLVKCLPGGGDAFEIAISKLGDAVLGDLITILKKKTSLSWAAAEVLGKMGTSALNELVPLYKKSKGKMRWLAAYAIACSGDSSAMDGLEDGLVNGDRTAKYRIVSIVGKFMRIDLLIHSLADDDICLEAVHILEEIGEAAIPALMEALSSEDMHTRRWSAHTLGELKAVQVVPSLIPLLKDKDLWVRSSAASALGDIGDARAVPALIKSLKDNDFNTTYCAAKALGKIGDISAFKPLVKALRNKVNTWLRDGVAVALGDLGDKKAIPVLVKLLTDPKDSVKINAARSLGQFKALEAFEPLVEVLRHVSGLDRDSAGRAIGALGHSIIPSLIELLDDPLESVRYGALTALYELRDERCIEHVKRFITDPDPDIRSRACQTLDLLDYDVKQDRAVIENGKKEREALLVKIGPLKKIAYIPVVEKGDGDVRLSKFCGTPLVSKEHPWPKCSHCQNPMSLFLQLNLQTLPDELQGEYGEGLLQLFYCTEHECEYEGEYLGSSYVVRIIDKNEEADASVVVGSTFTSKMITGWEVRDDYPDTEEMQDQKPQISLGDGERSVFSDLDYPLEVDKLAGWPAWVQSIAYPSCPKCKSTMRSIFQLASNDNISHYFGDNGRGHITQCPKHKNVLDFHWDCY